MGYRGLRPNAAGSLPVENPASFMLVALFSSLIQLVILALIVWLILRFVRAFEQLSEAAMGIARI